MESEAAENFETWEADPVPTDLIAPWAKYGEPRPVLVDYGCVWYGIPRR